MKQYWSPEGAVLVTRATSTGYYHRPVLVRSVTSTGSQTTLWSFLPFPYN